MFRTLADDAYESCRISIATSGVSGFLGCAVVAFLSKWSGDITGSEWPFIFTAALIGLGGKQLQQAMQRYLVGGILKKLGLNPEEDSDHGKKPPADN